MGKNAVMAPGQALRALEQANRVRLARAELKRRLGAGQVSAAEVVLSCPWEAESMTVGDLLMSQPRWGRARSHRLLVPLKVAENKPINALTHRQRTMLADALDAKAEPAYSGSRVPRSRGMSRARSPVPA